MADIAWWLIWLVGEEIKFGMEFYIHYSVQYSNALKLFSIWMSGIQIVTVFQLIFKSKFFFFVSQNF